MEDPHHSAQSIRRHARIYHPDADNLPAKQRKLAAERQPSALTTETLRPARRLRRADEFVRARPAPAGVVLRLQALAGDSRRATLARFAPAIRQQAVLSRAMPPNNFSQMTDDERGTLARWLGVETAQN